MYNSYRSLLQVQEDFDKGVQQMQLKKSEGFSWFKNFRFKNILRQMLFAPGMSVINKAICTQGR